jgi:hypothetical protein
MRKGQWLTRWHRSLIAGVGIKPCRACRRDQSRPSCLVTELGAPGPRADPAAERPYDVTCWRSGCGGHARAEPAAPFRSCFATSPRQRRWRSVKNRLVEPAVPSDGARVVRRACTRKLVQTRLDLFLCAATSVGSPSQGAGDFAILRITSKNDGASPCSIGRRISRGVSKPSGSIAQLASRCLRSPAQIS